MFTFLFVALTVFNGWLYAQEQNWVDLLAAILCAFAAVLFWDEEFA